MVFYPFQDINFEEECKKKRDPGSKFVQNWVKLLSHTFTMLMPKTRDKLGNRKRKRRLQVFTEDVATGLKEGIFISFEKIKRGFILTAQGVFINLKSIGDRKEGVYLQLHSLKRNDLPAHLEVDECFKISPLFQNIFVLFFKHYIEGICRFADFKKIQYRCHSFLVILCRMLSI